MGGNLEAAKREGLNILRLQLFVYCFMGFLAGIASIIQALLAQTVAPTAIMGRELEVIAATSHQGQLSFEGIGTWAMNTKQLVLLFADGTEVKFNMSFLGEKALNLEMFL